MTAFSSGLLDGGHGVTKRTSVFKAECDSFFIHITCLIQLILDHHVQYKSNMQKMWRPRVQLSSFIVHSSTYTQRVHIVVIIVCLVPQCITISSFTTQSTFVMECWLKFVLETFSSYAFLSLVLGNRAASRVSKYNTFSKC